MLSIAGGILFSRVGCGDENDDDDDEEGKDGVFDVRRATSLRTLPRSRGTSPAAAAALRGRRGGSPCCLVGSLRAYNRAVVPRGLFTNNCRTNCNCILVAKWLV